MSIDELLIQCGILGMTLEEYLSHFGIPGMKWGIRRGPGPVSAEAKANEKARRNDSGQYTSGRKASSGQMTDKELKSKVERLRLEQEYTKLTKGDVQNGKSIVDSIIKDSAKSVGTTVLTAAGLYAIKQTLAKRYGQDFVDKMFAKKK